jgi:hypothetical protein
MLAAALAAFPDRPITTVRRIVAAAMPDLTALVNEAPALGVPDPAERDRQAAAVIARMFSIDNLPPAGRNRFLTAMGASR